MVTAEVVCARHRQLDNREASMGPRLVTAEVTISSLNTPTARGLLQWGRGWLPRKSRLLRRQGPVRTEASMGPRLVTAEVLPCPIRRTTLPPLQWGRGWLPRKSSGRRRQRSTNRRFNGAAVGYRGSHPVGGSARAALACFNGAAVGYRGSHFNSKREIRATPGLQWGRGWLPRKSGMR